MSASAEAAIAALNGMVIDGHRMTVEKEDVDKAKRKKSEKEVLAATMRNSPGLVC